MYTLVCYLDGGVLRRYRMLFYMVTSRRGSQSWRLDLNSKILFFYVQSILCTPNVLGTYPKFEAVVQRWRLCHRRRNVNARLKGPKIILRKHLEFVFRLSPG